MPWAAMHCRTRRLWLSRCASLPPPGILVLVPRVSVVVAVVADFCFCLVLLLVLSSLDSLAVVVVVAAAIDVAAAATVAATFVLYIGALQLLLLLTLMDFLCVSALLAVNLVGLRAPRFPSDLLVRPDMPGRTLSKAAARCAFFLSLPSS